MQNILKSCNETSKNELQEITQDVEKQLENLMASLNAMLTHLDEATSQRKELEEITEYCQHWFKQADINLAVEIRNSTTPEILVEHIMVVSLNNITYQLYQNLINNNTNSNFL